MAFPSAPNYDHLLKIPHQVLPKELSSQALGRLWRDADRSQGLPVLLKFDGLLEEMLREGRYEEGREVDFDQYAAPYIEDLLTNPLFAPVLDRVDVETAEGEDRFATFDLDKEGDVVLALVPVRHPWEIFRHLPVGGFNECPDANTFAAFFRAMYERYGTTPAVISGDTMEMVVARRPATHEEARDLALKVYAFCPDALHGVEHLDALAEYLVNSGIWGFWWD